MASLHYHEQPRDIIPERVSTTPRLASLTRHGTRVNHACPPSTLSHVALLWTSPHTTWDPCYHACPPRLPFTPNVELGRNTIFHGDLATLVLHTCSQHH